MSVDPTAQAGAFAIGRFLPPTPATIPLSIASIFLSAMMRDSESPEQLAAGSNEAERLQRANAGQTRQAGGGQSGGGFRRSKELPFLRKRIAKGRAAREQGAGRLLNEGTRGFLASQDRRGGTRHPREGDDFRPTRGSTPGAVEDAATSLGSPSLAQSFADQAFRTKRRELRGGGR